MLYLSSTQSIGDLRWFTSLLVTIILLLPIGGQIVHLTAIILM